MDGDTPAVPSIWADKKKFYLILLCSIDVWTLYLHFRQLEFLWWNAHIPQALEGVMTPNEYEVARAQATFFVILGALSLLGRLYSRTNSIIDGHPSKIWASTTLYSQDNIIRVLIYVALDDIMTKCIIIPLVIILSMTNKGLKMNPLGVALAGISWLLASAAIAVLKTAFMIRETDRAGTTFFIYLAAFNEAVMVIGHTIFIGILAPWLMPRLPDGLAKSRIDSVAEKAGYYPSHRIYLEPNEQADPNAYHAGIFGTSMIVVSGTLLQVVGPSDIAAVVAHELGHWAYGHSYYGFAASVISNVCFMIAATWAYGNQDIYEVFNFDPSDPPPPIMGVLLFSKYIFPSIGSVILGLRGIVGFFCEYAADGFAVGMGLGQELRSSLTNLLGKLKIFPGVDPWYAAWFRGHPSMIRRIEVLSS